MQLYMLLKKYYKGQKRKKSSFGVQNVYGYSPISLLRVYDSAPSEKLLHIVCCQFRQQADCGHIILLMGFAANTLIE